MQSKISHSFLPDTLTSIKKRCHLLTFVIIAVILLHGEEKNIIEWTKLYLKYFGSLENEDFPCAVLYFYFKDFVDNRKSIVSLYEFYNKTKYFITFS